MKHLSIADIFEIIFYLLCVGVIITLAIIYKSNIFELISTILGLIAVALNTKKETKCFFVYIFYVSIYGIISLINKQYGEGILNLCYNLPLYLITIYNLFIKKEKSKNKDENIKNINKKGWIIILILVPIVTVVYGLILSLLKSNDPYFNSLATSLSIIAVFLASRLYKQQWLFWILYSAVLTYIWFNNFAQNSQTGILYLALNIIYIILNIKGYISWHKLELQQKEKKV